MSSFYEFLIVSEQYAGRDNPIVKNVDQAAARVPDRYRPPLMNARRQQPVRRVLRVKTVEPVPWPMPNDVYRALLDELQLAVGVGRLHGYVLKASLGCGDLSRCSS
ncbi:hypothetical protein [Streptomyces sp. f150]|uniref:hypothetical protein n=1 Tax=Streptomyces sp. f150 TaxID=1827699 RepID=UPI00117F449B|nr:hypothetical protein [Streptomyces sp. f150]